MPPRRRAQGPPSSPPPLPLPTRRREPSPSPPRLPLQSRPPYAPSDLLPEGTKRRRKLSARAKVDEDQERNKDTVPPAPGKTPGRSTPKQRKEWAEYLQRQAAAAQRARDRQQREEDERESHT